jgi:predicted ATPase
MGKRKALFRAPFLKSLKLLPERFQDDAYPFNLPILEGGKLELVFDRPITFFIGDNGTGKSTLLEAIAKQCGFNLAGGNRDHAYSGTPQDMPLANALRLSWLPKVAEGFFLRAESFFNFASFIDENYREFPPARRRFGERDLHDQSHGQSFMALFDNRLGDDRRGIYILDEPEAALAPARQVEFLKRLRQWERTARFQFIIATHSPIIMSYPGATLLSFDGGHVREIAYTATDHYRVTRAFLQDHRAQLARLFAADEADPADDGAA